MKRQYSFSKLDIYERCPHAYRKVYLDKVPRGLSEALQIGSALHGLTAKYLEHLIGSGSQIDLEWATGATPKNGHPDVAEIWQNFYNAFLLPEGEGHQVERQLAFTRDWQPAKDYFGADAYFRLVVDWTFLQGDLAVVIDWKSNRTMPATVEKELQLRIYGWAVRQAFYPDAQEILLRLHFLRYGREREILLTPADLDTVPREIEERIAVIEGDKEYRPTPGSFCGYCGLTAHCPVMAQALIPADVLLPATREQAEKAASLLLTLQSMEKQLADRLKQWVNDNGAVQVGDMVYGPSHAVSYDLDPEAVVQTLLDAGLDREAVWPLLSTTKTALERGLKKLKRGDLLSAALGCGEEKVTEKISWRKAT